MGVAQANYLSEEIQSISFQPTGRMCSCGGEMKDTLLDCTRQLPFADFVSTHLAKGMTRCLKRHMSVRKITARRRTLSFASVPACASHRPTLCL